MARANRSYYWPRIASIRGKLNFFFGFCLTLKNALCLKDVGSLLLELESQLPGTEIFLSGDFIQTFRLLKSKNHQYLGLETKNDQSKTTLFSQTFKVSKNKVPSSF